MKSGDLQKAFGVGVTTIKNWVDEFGEFLSDGARGVESRHRHFTQSDFIIMATIAELSQRQKYPYSVIRERLQQGYRVDNPTAATVGYEDGRLVPAAAVEQIVDAAELRVELEQIKADRDKLLSLLEEARKDSKEWRERYHELERELRETQRLLGRLEGRLEEMDKRDPR